MSNIVWILLAFALLKSEQQKNAQTPDELTQQIRDENADFWRSVGGPFDVSNGKTVSTVPFIDGISQAPFDAADVSIGGGFVT